MEKIFRALVEDADSKSDYVVVEDKLHFRKQSNQVHYRLYIPESLVHHMLHAYHNDP